MGRFKTFFYVNLLSLDLLRFKILIFRWNVCIVSSFYQVLFTRSRIVLPLAKRCGMATISIIRIVSWVSLIAQWVDITSLWDYNSCKWSQGWPKYDFFNSSYYNSQITITSWLHYHSEVTVIDFFSYLQLVTKWYISIS